MKRIIYISLLTLLCLSCSHKGYDPVEAQQLCAEFQVYRTLEPQQIDRLITQETYALNDIRSTLESLNNITSDKEFDRRYNELRNDTAFVSMNAMSEMMWHVLVLSQPKFSKGNMTRFEEVNKARRIVDMLNDELLVRIYVPEKQTAAEPITDGED